MYAAGAEIKGSPRGISAYAVGAREGSEGRRSGLRSPPCAASRWRVPYRRSGFWQTPNQEVQW